MEQTISTKSDTDKSDILKKVAIGVGIGATVGIAAPVAIGAGLATAGFGAGGVVAGSLAAGIQSSIGSVAAGSLFASEYLNENQRLEIENELDP